MKLSEKAKTILSSILLFIFLIMITFGVHTGEINTVLTKAVNICLECIGIG